MRWFALMVCNFCFIGCAPFLADGFGSHHTETNIYQYVTIPSYGLELVTPGDIRFTDNRREVRKAVKRTGYDHVVLY